jgi:hypothetical protein
VINTAKLVVSVFGPITGWILAHRTVWAILGNGSEDGNRCTGTATMFAVKIHHLLRRRSIRIRILTTIVWNCNGEVSVAIASRTGDDSVWQLD